MAYTSQQLKPAIRFAFAELERGGSDMSRLPAAIRTVVIIVSAQGVIDNGGLQYFFESDFPGSPPYGTFVDAYREIGAVSAAKALAEAIALFPFDEPNTSVEKRNAFMDSFKDEEGDPLNSPFTPLTAQLCGNHEVWSRLEAYVSANRAAFET